MKIQSRLIRFAEIRADIKDRLDVLEAHVHHAEELQPAELLRKTAPKI